MEGLQVGGSIITEEDDCSTGGMQEAAGLSLRQLASHSGKWTPTQAAQVHDAHMDVYTRQQPSI